MIALADVTSMYSSIEKIYSPSLRNKPVAVLSNNDSNIVAVCPIAKRLGFEKFVPYFEVRDAAKKAGLVFRSSNYELYSDVSSKMFTVLSDFCDELFEYSIDEAFMKFDTQLYDHEWINLGYEIRKAIWRQVKLPIGVGFGPTNTLAKAANHASKKLEGFRGSAIINSELDKKAILERMSLTDTWGVGTRLAKRLEQMGIKNAYELSLQEPSKIRKYYSITLENTVRELQGEPRLSWDDTRPLKKEIYSTRSFGTRVVDIHSLKSSLAAHAEIVTKKLRDQKCVAGSATFFAANSPYDSSRYVKKSTFTSFEVPTSDTRKIINAISMAIDKLFIPGIRYYKSGVGLLDIREEKYQQGDLFTQCTDNKALMSVVDNTNARYGRNTLHFASKGFEQKFTMRRDFLSKRSTTRWSDIPRIKC